MKFVFTVAFFFIFFNLFSQEEFIIEGKIIGHNGIPVSDAYLINFRDLNKTVTNSSGIFSMQVQPSDSLVISHISYHRKIISVYQLLVNPTIQLQVDSISISEINISPDQQTDYERARENIESIKSMNIPSFTKIKPEPDPVLEMATEHNRVMRTEASSISIYRFSPSEKIGKLFKKFKKKDKTQNYSSTKKLKKQESK